ncbi:MAG: Tad domain-containing protein [Gemmatimonadaceae bacterium]
MLAFVGVSMVALLGAVALVLDTGLGQRQRRIAQTSADAGAIGGAQEIIRNRQDLADAGALAEAVRNGFDASEVTVFYPPATGLFIGNPAFVEVVIARNVPTLMAHLFNRSSWDVRARAVAGVSTTSFNCIYTLNPTGVSLQLDGSIVANCGVSVNGTLDAKAGSNLDATSISAAIVDARNADIDPPASSGAAASPNPLAAFDTVIANYIAPRVPLAQTCDYATKVVVSADLTLNPGTYCGGISVNTGSHKLTLNPGVYIIAGGGFTVQTSGRVDGAGVTIINTNGPVNNPALYEPFYFGNGSKCNLTSPPSGELFEGMLLIQDPEAGETGTTYVNTFACADDTPLGGTIYLPTQTAFFQGSNNSTQINGSIISYIVEVAPGTALTMNQPVTSNSVIKRISLVE